MSVYAIGDIQGCYRELRALLERLGFEKERDRLWFAGDLVNRGPDSLATLRYVKDLGDAAVTVLGNHELHLLAVAHGHLRYHKHDTFHDVLNAPDRHELLEWLRQRPLLHHDAENGHTLIHAGLPPQWDLPNAQACAEELQTILRSADYHHYWEHLYGNEPEQWSESLRGWDRLRYITNCFTRLRYCDEHGRLALEYKGPPGTQPHPYRPWFDIPQRASADMTIIFGHWSTLGPVSAPGVFALDTGCQWGGALTALRLEDHQRISIPCPKRD